jgi:hypothetical protein
MEQSFMEGDERWLKLCAEVAVEKDPERQMQLTNEMLRFLSGDGNQP